MRRIISLILTLAMILPAAVMPVTAEAADYGEFIVPLTEPLPEAGADGFIAPISEPDPNAVVITTAEELAAITNGSYVLGCDIYLEDYNGGVWNPISPSGAITLDGQGHKIYNLNIPESTGAECAGLIGKTDYDLTVCNLGLEYTIDSIGIHGKYAGGFVGYCKDNEITITNSYNAGNVTALQYAGGFVGGCYQYSPFALTITHSYNSGAVSVSSAETDSYAGGFVGYCYRDNQSYNFNDIVTISITGSYNIGAVTADIYGIGAVTDAIHVGGFVGYCYSKDYHSSAATVISNSYNSGAVSVSSAETYSYAGGFVGRQCYRNIAITNSCNIGDVSVSSKENGNHVGGFVGYCYEVADEITLTASITNSYNNGKINASSDFASTVGGFVGGGEIVNVENGYNKGKINAFACYQSIAGGFVGVGHSIKYRDNINVKDSYNTGVVSASTLNYDDEYYDVHAYTGGLTGRGSVTVDNAYSTGDRICTAYSVNGKGYEYNGPLTGRGSVDYVDLPDVKSTTLAIQDKTDKGEDCRVIKPGDTINISVYLASNEVESGDVVFAADSEYLTVESQDFSQAGNQRGYFNVALKAAENAPSGISAVFTASASNGAADSCNILIRDIPDFRLIFREGEAFAYDGEFIDGVSVTVNGITKLTDAQGVVTYTAEELGGDDNISLDDVYCEKEGYIDNGGYIFPFENSETGQRYGEIWMFKKKPGEIYITEATIKLSDTRVKDMKTDSETVYLRMEDTTAYPTAVKVDWNGLNPQGLFIKGMKSGKTYLLPVAGGTVNIPYYSAFDADEKLYLYAQATDENGEYKEKTLDTHIKVQPIKVILDFPDSTKHSTEGLWFLNGVKLGVGFESLDNTSSSVSYSDGVLTIEYTKKDKKKTGLTVLEMINGKKENKPRVSVTGKILVPLCRDWEKKGMSASIKAELSAESKDSANTKENAKMANIAEDSFAFYIANVPAYVKYKLKGKGTAELKFYGVYDDLQTKGKLDVKGNAYFAGGLGLDGVTQDSKSKAVKDNLEIHLEVGGDFTVDLPYTVDTAEGSEFDPSIDGKISLEAALKVFKHGGKLKLNGGGFKWDKTGVKWEEPDNYLEAELAGINNAQYSDFVVDDMEYLNENSGFCANDTVSLMDETSGGGAKVFYKNIIKDAEAVQTEIGGVPYIFFTSHDAAREPQNSLVLMYSKNENGVWSEPEQVDNDGTFDSKIGADNGFLIWENANRKLDSSVTLEDGIAAMDVKTAVFNGSSWVTTEFGTENVMDFATDIASSGNKAVAAWLSNSENDLSARTGITSLHYTLYDGEAWSETTAIDNIGTVSAINVLYGDDTPIIVYKDDETLHAVNASTGENNICAEHILRYAACVKDNAVSFVHFDADKNLHLPDGAIIKTEYSQNENPKYIVSESGDFVFWLEDDGIYYTVNTNGEWSEKLCMYSSEKCLRQLDVSSDGSAYRLTWTENDGSVKDMMIMDKTRGADLVIDSVIYNEDVFNSTGMVSASVTIRNNGDVAANGFGICVTENGETNFEGGKTETLSSGASVEYSFSFKPKIQTGKNKLNIEATPIGREDANSADNVCTLETGITDISVSDGRFTTEGDTIMLNAVVSNNGSGKAENISIRVYENSYDSEPITEYVLDGLAANNTFLYRCKIEPKPETAYYIKVEAENDEDNYNDLCMLYMEGEDDTPILSIVGAEHSEENGTVTARVYSENPTEDECAVILAVYDTRGRLMKMIPKAHTFTANGSSEELMFDLSDMENGNYRYKILIWDNFKTCTPKTAAYELR